MASFVPIVSSVECSLDPVKISDTSLLYMAQLYSAVDTAQPNRRKYEGIGEWRVFLETIRLNCYDEGPGFESQLAHDFRPAKNFQKSLHRGRRDRNDREQPMSVLNWSAKDRCVSSGVLTVWRTRAMSCRSCHIMRRLS
jgi:hypothetical protein